MLIHNLSLPPELDNFVQEHMESGRFESASQVVCAALRCLKREEQIAEAKLKAERASLDEAAAHEFADGAIFAQVRQVPNLPDSMELSQSDLVHLVERDPIGVGTGRLV
jgi:putative addiction module CopG family antidote